MVRVWVTQESGHDYTSAEKYGDVKFVTANDFSNSINSLVNKQLLEQIRRAAREFVPGDWIVIAGSPYVAASFIQEIGRIYAVGNLNFLRWDNRDYEYRELKIVEFFTL